MDNLGFSGEDHNQRMDLLIETTLWLAEQFKAAIELMPNNVVINALQNGDAAHKFFLFAGTEHLPNLAAATNVMKTAPAPQPMSNVGMLMQAQALGVAPVEVDEITAGDVDAGWPNVEENAPNNP